jgi:hypothetical protein
MTYPLAPGLFNLTSLAFTLLGGGTGNTLTITGVGGGNNSTSFSTPPLNHNEYYTPNFALLFQGVSKITFSTTDGGNVRIDNIVASPVPLPAAGLLLLGGLGGFGFLARRRTAS